MGHGDTIGSISIPPVTMGNPPSRHRGNVGSPGSCSGQEDGQVVDAAAGVFHQLPVGCL